VTLTKLKPAALLLKESALNRFETRLHGSLIVPGDETYDQARQIWNGMIDRYPALIVRAADAADVSETLAFARNAELPVSIRGGGHSLAGLALNDGGVVIDLSRMKRIVVNHYGHTARVQPGVTLGEFVRATEPFNLATTIGTVSGTGIAGLTLGGGMGWLMGKYGLTVDNLLAVEIVTADGQQRHASEDEYGDLLWAVRGGGGNFGVVTEFSYRLHPFGAILGGMVAYPIDKAREVLRFYREFSAAAPDELTVYAALVSAPDGTPVVAIAAAHFGPLADGELLMAPLRRFGQPLVDTIRPLSHYELTAMLDDGVPDGRRYYEKGVALPQLSDEAIDLLAIYGTGRSSPFSQILIQHVHGAAARIATETNAASGLRGTHYEVAAIAGWDTGADQPHLEWARGLGAVLKPLARDAIYVNFLGDEGEARVRAAYGANYERLLTTKNRYDPTNIFRFNQNIRPTAGSSNR
jgi:FAD/FMN-containing dehydrogenase